MHAATLKQHGRCFPLCIFEMLTSMIVALIESGDLAAAGTAGAALAQCRDAGDLLNLPFMLAVMADLDMRAGHFQDAAAQLYISIRTVRSHLDRIRARPAAAAPT